MDRPTKHKNFSAGYTWRPKGEHVLVTEAYQRRCVITGEKTLPVLNAFHIKPYSQEGPHKVRNGLLMWEDLF